MDFTLAERKIHAVKRADTGEKFADPRNSSKAVSCIVFASIMARCVQRGYTECSIYAVPHAAISVFMRSSVFD